MFTVGQVCYFRCGCEPQAPLVAGRVVEASDYAVVVEFGQNVFPQFDSETTLFAECRGLMMEHPVRVSGHRQNRAPATVEFTRVATSWPTAVPAPESTLAGAA